MNSKAIPTKRAVSVEIFVRAGASILEAIRNAQPSNIANANWRAIAAAKYGFAR